MRRSTAVVVIALIAAAQIAASADRIPASEGPAPGFELAADNCRLELYLNPDNTQIAVVEKRSGRVWYSNPQDLATAERIAKGASLASMRSQILIGFYVSGDRWVGMNNQTESVEYGQHDIEYLGNGVRITYDFGKRWADEAYLPVMISKERFDELILSRLDDDDEKELMLENYELVELVEPEPEEQEISVSGIGSLRELFSGKTLVSPGRVLSTNAKKELIGNLLNKMVDYRRDIDWRAQLGPDDFQQLINNPTYVLASGIWAWDLKDMIAICRKVGYRPEDATVDHEQNHIDPPVPNLRVFHIPVEYRLDEDSLVVTIPMEEVVYPLEVEGPNGELVTMPLATMTLLPYFGAAGENEEGYIFVPDGSGAIMKLNNGKLRAAPYRAKVYGVDNSIAPTDEQPHSSQQVHLPVFGIKAGEQAMLAIIENGEAFATIEADIAGRTCSYNTAYPTFTVIPSAQTSLSGSLSNAVISIFQSRAYRGDITMRYFFLEGEDADYSGMACRYRDYLITRMGMERIAGTDRVPFVLELVGAVSVRKPILGIPRSVMIPVTKFEQAVEIVDACLDSGISDMKVKYTGWLSGGILHDYPDKCIIEPSLGSEDDLVRLGRHLAEVGAEFFLEVGFLNVHRDKMLDGFSARADAARFLNRKYAKVYGYDLATYQRIRTEFHHILSPRSIEGLVHSFLVGYERLGVGGLALRYMGMQVNSDFRDDPEMLIDRQESRHILESVAERLASEYSLMISGGNAFMLPHASLVTEQPLTSSNFNILDAGVPFLQMALHGLCTYTGPPLNLNRGYEETVLRMIEVGAAPSYVLGYEYSSELKGTDYDYLYTLQYRRWIQEAAEVYGVINEALGGLHGEFIIDHSCAATGVYKVTYENGDSVFVNYNEEPVVVEGVLIGARNFRRVKGEGRE